MRVNLTSEFSLPRDITKAVNIGDKPFSEHLKTFSVSHLREHMEGELVAIEEQGRRLCRRMTLGDLRKYKQMVADFIRACISQGLSLKEEQHTTGFGRTKMLSVIKTVNEKLLSLAQLLLSENQDPLKAMALVDEIRGLLLDLYA